MCFVALFWVLLLSVCGFDQNKDIVLEPVLPSPTLTTTARSKNLCPIETHLCVPYYHCGDGNDIGDNLDNPCSSSILQNCCLLTDVHNGFKHKTSSYSVRTSSNASPTNETHQSLIVQTTMPTRAKCGLRNKEGLTSRITDTMDNEAEVGEFPWMVALFEETDVLGYKSTVFKCGGSLIHPQVVLTAAHCLKKRPMTARAGEWDIQAENEVILHQDRKVTETIIHEGFHKGGLFNDIALLVLESEFEPADNIGYVCLPNAGCTFDSVQCTASGWGAHTHGGMEQTILKRIDLPIVPRRTCQDLFRVARKQQTYELHESYLCAGGLEGKDTCKGDGGSPLVCPTMVTLEQYVQAGIVSWGRGCGSAQIPGVYADVAVLRDWVDMKMRERNLDISYYEI